LYGNGGYDVKHYLLKLSYNPATDRLVGVATITARATQNLCRFNLDFQGMTVRSVAVNGKRARWSRSADHELTVTPQRHLKKGKRFTTVVRYDGVPRTQIDLSIPDEPLPYGWIHTDDGAVVVSEPEGSASWFPVNDHPTDKAAFTFVVTVPAGLEAISNGRLVGRRTHGRRTTWVWDAPDPMAPYLARQGEILDFLSGQFGVYPFSTGGGIVDDAPTCSSPWRCRPARSIRGPPSPIRRRRPPGPCATRSVTRTSSGSCGPGRPRRPVVTAPPGSSSRWPSASPGSSSTPCSMPGCSPPASPRSPHPRPRPRGATGPRRSRCPTRWPSCGRSTRAAEPLE
ncbi:MAG: hypothetical protein ACRDUA_24735, partial [Micromonosporaceae bacterium]